MAEQSEKELIIKKAKALWADKRTYGNRLMLAGSAMLAACFTFIFFGPFEMVAFGINSLEYTYMDVIWLLLAAMAGVSVCGTLAISMLRGKLFNYVVAVIFSITVAGYLQAALLNGSVGALTGEAVDWARLKTEMAVSIAAWIAVFIAVITVLYFHRVFWRNMVIGASLLLVVMQTAPLVGILLGAYEEARIPESSGYYFTNSGSQEFSENENVFVFILDYMDYDYVEAIYHENPAFFDDFEGFMGYTNAVSVFGRTRPSVCNILTGYTEGAYLIPDEEYMKNAWESKSPNLLDILQEQEYSIEMYAKTNEVFGAGDIGLDYVSNLAERTDANVSIIPGTMLKKLLYLSVYRYAPTALKPFFWEYTSFYNEDVYRINGAAQDDSDLTDYSRFNTENSAAAELLSQGTAERSANCFKLYHLDGSHPPCYLNRAGVYTYKTTDEYEQTWGCLNLLKTVFAHMQELGIYEDATIILTADHGEVGKMAYDSFPGMRTALFYKPAGSAQTPLVWSDAQVSTANIPATIVQAVGADSDRFGLTLDEVGSDPIERVFFREYSVNDKPYLDKYIISGDAGDAANWELIETKEITHPFY